MRVAVIGAGIAGLTSAIAVLREHPSVAVTVLEQAPRLTWVGAGIMLWPNAIRALERVGVWSGGLDRVSGRGSPIALRSATGATLLRADGSRLVQQVGHSAFVHRADLLDVLLDRVGRDRVRLGCTVIETSPDGSVGWRQDSSTRRERFDLVVAADGLHSRTRLRHWGVTARPAGMSTLRAVLPMTVDSAAEVWGRGRIAGYLPLPAGRTYLYLAWRDSTGATGTGAMDTGATGTGATGTGATGTGATGTAATRRRLPRPDESDAPKALAGLGDWPDPLPRLAAAARAGQGPVRVDDLAQVPMLPSYVLGSVVLVGDAAHGMLPFLGQGACQGIEDAVTLAGHLGNLPRYDRLRRRRAGRVHRASARAGRIAMLDGLAARLRDTVLPLVPPAVPARATARLVAAG